MGSPTSEFQVGYQPPSGAVHGLSVSCRCNTPPPSHVPRYQDTPVTATLLGKFTISEGAGVLAARRVIEGVISPPYFAYWAGTTC